MSSSRAPGGVAGEESPTAFVGQVLEPCDVQLRRSEIQHVADLVEADRDPARLQRTTQA